VSFPRIYRCLSKIGSWLKFVDGYGIDWSISSPGPSLPNCIAMPGLGRRPITMLERKFDPTLTYRYARYGRMSDPKQNKRSPDQQFATIEETRQRCGYPWHCVATYRDQGISGLKIAGRPGFQNMLRDIEAERITIDLIVVDTLERFGRAEEIAEIRRKLNTRHGVLVVAADNNFADPTGIVGKAVGVVEHLRSTEDTRIKGHNVIRGKKDAARLRRWPGGPVPFGYRLKAVVDESVSPPKGYHLLEPEPREAAALQMAFRRAHETGEGTLRLSKWWNGSPEIPEEFKPITPYTMGYRLRNPIYVGILVWGANSTGIVDDTRVVEANLQEEVLRIPNFCTPLVSNELFDAVQTLMCARGRQVRAARQKSEVASPQKRFAPQARGMTLKYLLTGLVRCGSCRASMRPVPTGATSKTGRKYTYYTCPRHYEGACHNSRHFPERQLREAVLSRFRSRLFPPTGWDGEAPEWFPGLMHLVQQEHRRYQADTPDRAAAIEKELQDLNRQLQGWTMTLGDPQLAATVRGQIVGHYEAALSRRQQLEEVLNGEHARQQHIERTLDPKAVIAQLHRLSEVLASYNPTLGNLELGRHIDRIDCFADGGVMMRGTLLGLFEGAVELLSRDDRPASGSPDPQLTGPYRPVVPRRRGRLRIPDLAADSKTSICDVDSSLHPQRFAGLAEPLFWTESFVMPRRLSWAEEHAEEVYLTRSTTGLSFKELATRFGKSRPTMQHAWRIADGRRQTSGQANSSQPHAGTERS
jgi:DNA invertase Pin-like site-specific DNA recombinase